MLDALKNVTDQKSSPMSTSMTEGAEKYRVVAPEAMHETFMSDSEEEGGKKMDITIVYFYCTFCII